MCTPIWVSIANMLSFNYTVIQILQHNKYLMHNNAFLSLNISYLNTYLCTSIYAHILSPTQPKLKHVRLFN